MSEEAAPEEMMPKDPAMLKIFAAAVEDGLAMVRQFEAEKKYIGNHFSWPRITHRDNGLPTFSEISFSGPTNYSSVLFPISGGPIDFTSIPSFQALLNFARSHTRLCEYLKLSEGKDARLGNVVVMSRVGDMIDCYIHRYKDTQFIMERFLPLYLLMEAGILNSKLQISIIVPLLLLPCSFETVQLGPTAFLAKMDDDLQLARFLEMRDTPGVHRFVSEAASHALVLWGYEIENQNFWDVTNALSRMDTYPSREVDLFFAALRIVTGLPTGYAQILAEPLGWTFAFKAHLTEISSVYVRSYPNWFEKLYWNAPLPVLTEQQALEVGEIYSKMQVLQSREIEIAARRLNLCYLRETEEDTLLDATIALETLLSDDEHQEMTHKLAMRVAALSKFTKDARYDPLEMFRTVKKIYAYRSAVVHGNTKAHKQQEVQLRSGQKVPTKELAIEYLRLVLQILIEHPEYLKPEIIDQDLLLGS